MGPRIVSFHNWKNNLLIENDMVELIITLDVGPRIISYRRKNAVNVFKIFESMLGQSGEPHWAIRGGHRLWVAPEDPAYTYAVDNGPVSHEILGPHHVRVTPAQESSGWQKSLDIKLTGDAGVEIIHTLRNCSQRSQSAAAWALTVMAAGGTLVIPLPPPRAHPGEPTAASTAQDYAPQAKMVLWPFTDLTDPRWMFGQNAITLTQARQGATKMGFAHQAGAIGYWNAGQLFTKRFSFVPSALYPDQGVNFEAFSNEEMLEMESLSPLVTLAPGESLRHTETWDLHAIPSPQLPPLATFILPILTR